MDRRISAAILFTWLLLAGCQPGGVKAENNTLTVFAASSLTEAFGEIGAQFEAAHPGVELRFNFAGSQQLAQQLVQGASADLYASADPSHLLSVQESGLIDPAAARPFISNSLVVIFPPDNPGKITVLADLAKPGLRICLAAPNVPAGRYSLELLQKAALQPGFPAGFEQLVLQNVVSQEENVRAVFGKIALGEADAGLVYASDIQGGNASKVGALNIPQGLNVAAVYWIAPLKGSSGLAGDLIGFILSEAGQKILGKYGFTPLP